MYQSTTNSKRKLSSDENEAEVVAQKRVKSVEGSFSSPFEEASLLSSSQEAASGGWEDEYGEWPPPIQYSEAESEDEDHTVEEEGRHQGNAKESLDIEERKKIKAEKPPHEENERKKIKAEGFPCEKEERKEINPKVPLKEDDQPICKVKRQRRRRAGFSTRMHFLGINCTKQGKAMLASKSDVLESIGPDPNAPVPIKPKIHDTAAVLWSNILKGGLPAVSRANLLKLYPGLANCNVAPPKLNPEVVVQLNRNQVAKDARLCSKQELAGASITALGQALCMLTSTPKENWNQEQLVKWLGDAAKLTASLHHEESITRKTMVTPLFPDEFRAVCETSKSDDFLFGENLGRRAKGFKQTADCLNGKYQPRQYQQQGPQGMSRSRRSRTRGRFPFEIPRPGSRETDQKNQQGSDGHDCR